MINFAFSASLYQAYADMVAYDELRHSFDGPHTYCAYFGRRDGKRYVYSNYDIVEAYREELRLTGRMPAALSGAMGNQVYVACFETKAALEKAYQEIFALKEPLRNKKNGGKVGA